MQTFSSTPGYIEKDRGRQFPSHWIWVQTNAFPGAEEDVSLTGSIARIPYLGLSFPGHIVGLKVGATLYRFTTYTGALTTRLEVNDEEVVWELQDASHGLEIVVDRKGVGAEVAEPLWGPRDGTTMTPYVNESLGATVAVTLWRKKSQTVEEWARWLTPGLQFLEPASSKISARETIFKGVGMHAGLEVMAKAEELRMHPALVSVLRSTPLGHPLAGAALVVAVALLCASTWIKQ